MYTYIIGLFILLDDQTIHVHALTTLLYVFPSKNCVHGVNLTSSENILQRHKDTKLELIEWFNLKKV